MAHAHVAAEAVGLQHAELIVVMTGDEVRIEVRCKFEIGLAEPIHPHHEPGVLDVRLDQPDVRSQANEEHDGKHQEREDAKVLAEPGRLRHQGERNDGGRENREEGAGPAEDLVPGRAARRQQIPVFRRQDLGA